MNNQPTRQEFRSKKNLKKQQKLLKKQRKKERKWFVKAPLFFLKFITFLFGFGVLAGVGGVAWFWQSPLRDTISENIAEGYRLSETIDIAHFEKLDPTQLVDGEGEVIREFKERSFQYLDLQKDDDLFEKVSDVVVSIEDERFYRHKGFDYFGVGVAVLNYVKGGELRGASTITQQVVKNTYLSQTQTMERKIQEAVISQELENVFTKRQILEFYVNGNYYANGRYGLATAAQYYYSKPVSDLTSGELAVLTGIPNNPTIYDPIANPENALTKRNVILAKMLELGKIDQEEFDGEKAKDLNLNITPAPVDNSVTDYAESYAVDQAVEFLMEANGFELKYWFETTDEKEEYKTAYNEMFTQMRQDILRGGYKIETSINSNQQAILQKAIDDQLAMYPEKNAETGLYKKQASAVTIDHRTNEVVAIIGGRNQEGNSFNRAYLGARQPASSIKPFVAYAVAFENGQLPQSTMQDKAILNGPGNWYDGYRGTMTLRKALEQSVNTIAYQLVLNHGSKAGIEKMEKMRFASLDPNDDNPAISLGGFTFGATTLELASALNTFVNQGQYTRPTNIRKITHLHTEEVYYDREEDVRYESVYEPEAAYMGLDIMKDSVDFSTGKLGDWGYEHLAGKTGTSNGRKDQWFVGTTPYYATAVWVGNDHPEPQPYVVSERPMAIFKQAMSQYHKGLKVIDFKKPNNVIRNTDGSFVVYKQYVETKNPKQVQRETNERYRKENESQSLRERLVDLDYRIKHGLTWKEEEEREHFAALRIQVLNGVEIKEVSDFDNATTHYKEALNALERVKRASAKEQLSRELETAYANKRQQKEQIEWTIKENERLKREAIERQQQLEKAQEEEARRQEEQAFQEELDRLNREQEKELEEMLEQEEAPVEEMEDFKEVEE